MINSIVSFCVRERMIVFLVTLFVVAAGWYSMNEVPIDAIPNVGDNQVIVLAEWPGRSPKDVEDQITYPLSVALQSVAEAESVRGKSMLGFSFVQVTFADRVDFYDARTRVAEELATLGGTAGGTALPEGVTPVLGPDATALGQIFYYVLEPPAGMGLDELRSTQDYVVKYSLQSVEGVAEVASIGGYVRQYQIEVDPDMLRFHDVTLASVLSSVRESNIDVGAKTIEQGAVEYLVRGVGFIGAGKSEAETIEQIEQIVITTRDNVPVSISDVASVAVGPAFRRGALDFNGTEAVGGVVVMRYGENPRQVIERVKERIASIESELGGIRIRGIYDRTQLVDETVATLTTALVQQITITAVVILLFLLHFRASLVVATTLPVAVLVAFIAMHTFSVDANIMSLAGIAIAIGTMVDMGIIISENIFRGLADWEKNGRQGGEDGRYRTIVRMTSEVAPAVVTAVSTTVISFLPVFFLTGRDYRLFAPLAWTKTYSLVASLIVAVLLVPPLAGLLLRSSERSSWRALFAAIVTGGLAAALCTFVWSAQLEQLAGFKLQPHVLTIVISLATGAVGYLLMKERLRPVEENLISRVVNFFYEPVLRFFLQFKRTFLAIPVVIIFFGVASFFGLAAVLAPVEHVARKLGADFERSSGYMEFKDLLSGLENDDWIALDEGSWFYMPSLYPAASFSQAMETLQTQDAMIRNIPEVENVLGKIGRVESALDPAPAAMIETYVMLKPKDQWRAGATPQSIWNEINEVATLPGITMADELQPIEGRVVMLQSGIKASMAVRIYGDTLEGLSGAAEAVSGHLREHPLVNSGTVSPDIVLGKLYVEMEVDRSGAARYGMTVRDVNEMIEAALGGMNATTTFEGRERFAIQVRYERSARDTIEDIEQLPVVTNTGEVVPLGLLAKRTTSWGPSMINSEDARLVAHVAFSPSGEAGPLETVDRVMKSLANARATDLLEFPDGSFELEPVGAFREQLESFNRLFWLAPLVGVEMPVEITSNADRFKWMLCWTPLGLLEIALLINAFIIYLQFRRVSLTVIVFSGIPVAFAGGMIALAISGVEMNTAVWVGFIALFGIAIDDGVVVATYLQQSLNKRELHSKSDVRNAVVEAGLKRIRPCLMTTFTTVIALLPVLTATGRGADVARAMAIPVFGGMVFELVTLFVVPVLYCGFLEFKLNVGMSVHNSASAPETGMIEPEVTGTP